MIRAEGVFNDPRIHVGVVRVDRLPDAAQRGIHGRKGRRPARRRHAALVRQIAQPLRPALEAARNQQDLRLVQERLHQNLRASAALDATLGSTPSLSADPVAQAEIKAGRSISYLDYDWNLNDKK